MKTRLFLTILSFFTGSVALAQVSGTIYYRGSVLAVDKRDHRSCQDTEARIRTLTESTTIENLCAKSNHKPFAVAITYVPISEYEFMADKKSNHGASKNESVLVVLPNEKELTHYTRLNSHRHLMKVEIIHLGDFLDMEEFNIRNLSFGFLLKTSASQIKPGVGAVVNKSLAGQRFNYSNHGAPPRYQGDAPTKRSSNVTPTDGSDERGMKIGIFFPPDICDEKYSCKDRDNYGIGISFTFIL